MLQNHQLQTVTSTEISMLLFNLHDRPKQQRIPTRTKSYNGWEIFPLQQAMSYYYFQHKIRLF